MKIEAKVVGEVAVDSSQYVTLDHVQLSGEDYSGRRLKSFCAIGSRFESCRFNNVSFDRLGFGGGQELCEIVECSFDGSHFKIGPGGFTRYIRCSFRDIEIERWFCFETEFIDCVFSGRLTQCIFNGTVPEEDRAWVRREKNEFRRNDFSGCDFVDVTFRTGIDLEQQRLPNGPDYLYVPDAAAAIARARRGLADWMPGTELQRRALVLVNVYADAVNNGQQQLLIRPSGHCKAPAKIPREVVDKVVDLLKAPN